MLEFLFYEFCYFILINRNSNNTKFQLSHDTISIGLGENHAQ